MKLPVPTVRHRAALTLLATLSSAGLLTAANLSWDPVNTTNGATIDPGSGTWDTTAGNTVWNNAGANVAWTQSNSAQFAGADAPEGSPYTINLATSVTVASTNNALWFANSGYILTAATTTRTITTPLITVSSGKTATLSGTITATPASNAALAIGGFGTLTVKDGARLSPNSNNTLLNHGNKVVLETGGIITGNQIVVGNGTANATPTQLTVAGGTVTVSSVGTTASTASNIVVCNVNANTATATLKISSGTVQNLGTGRASGGESGLRFGTTASGGTISGTVDLDGGTLVVARVYENALASINSTFNFNGGTLKVQTGAGNAANFLTGLDSVFVKEGGALVDTNGVATTIAQPLLHGGVAATDGGLIKQGAGTLTLTGANTFTGPTTINAGTLAITAPYFALTTTTVNSDGRLQIVSGASASSLPGLVLNSGGVELNLGVFDAGRLAGAAFASFEAAGDYAIHLSGTNIPVGAYTVFTYSGKTGPGLPTVGTLPAGVTATVQDTGSAVILSVLTPQVPNYFWSAGTGTWDTTTANWNGQIYAESSVATFPDLAGSNTVTLAAPRSPYAVAIQNNLGNTYTFAGAAIAGSASVSKTGTGAATFSVANTYTGATTVSEGALVVAVDGALGSAEGSTFLSPNTSIALSGGINYATAEKIVGSGPGPLVTNTGPLLALQRGLVQGVSGANTFAGPVEINASGFTRFGVQDGSSLTLAGPITVAAGVTGVSILFRAGIDGDFITLSSPGNQWDGPTVLFSGTTTGAAGLRLGVDDGIPVASSITGGGTAGNPLMTFDLAGHRQTLNGLVGSNGYVNIVNSSAQPSVLTLDLLTADVNQTRTDALLNYTTIHDGTGTGKVAVVKKGAFKQTLGGVHTYTGPTTIEAGTLAFVGTGALGSTAVTMFTGSTLDVAGVAASDFALNAGLAGSGTLTATGKTVTVSTSFAPGALAVTGNLTLAGGTATTLVAGATPEASSAVTVSGALVLNGTLAITEAAGFDFPTGWNHVFATGAITPGLTGVTVNGVALTESTPDVWTGNIAGLDYTFTETTATLAVSGGVAPSPLQTWRDTYFPTEGNDGTGIGANAADPDQDGVSNLVEYATNTSPVAANVSAVVQGTDAGRLTLTFPRIDDPTLRYTVEGRDDLVTGAWAAITPAAANNPTFGFAGTTPGVTETASETVVDSVLIATQPKRFLRLSVDFLPPAP